MIKYSYIPIDVGKKKYGKNTNEKDENKTFIV